MAKTKDLRKGFKSKAVLETENVELRKENKALKETITKLFRKLDNLPEESKSNVVKLQLTPEQEILEMQIMRLQAISRERVLTLDETRKLDLHIKNKRLMEDKSTINADYKKVPEGITEKDLLEIAGNVEIEEFQETKQKRRKSKTSS